MSVARIFFESEEYKSVMISENILFLLEHENFDETLFKPFGYSATSTSNL